MLIITNYYLVQWINSVCGFQARKMRKSPRTWTSSPAAARTETKSQWRHLQQQQQPQQQERAVTAERGKWCRCWRCCVKLASRSSSSEPRPSARSSSCSVSTAIGVSRWTTSRPPRLSSASSTRSSQTSSSPAAAPPPLNWQPRRPMNLRPPAPMSRHNPQRWNCPKSRNRHRNRLSTSTILFWNDHPPDL